MRFLIVRHVDVVVPVVFNEIDRAVARVIFVAMLAPLLRVAGRDAEVNGLRGLRDALDDDRLRIDHLRRRNVANIDTAIKAGLSDVDRYSNIRSPSRPYCGSQQQ